MLNIAFDLRKTETSLDHLVNNALSTLPSEHLEHLVEHALQPLTLEMAGAPFPMLSLPLHAFPGHLLHLGSHLVQLLGQLETALFVLSVLQIELLV